MMEIEKKFAKTDLLQYKYNVSSDYFKALMRELYKYQLFKNSVLLKKINKLNYKDASIIRYSNCLRRYLHLGVKEGGNINKAIYDVIDELKATHAPVLTPSPSDKHTQKHFMRTVKPKQAIEISPQTPEIKIQTIDIPPIKDTSTYAIKSGDLIKIYDDKDVALVFLNEMKVFSDKKLELVKVSYEVVDQIEECE